MKRKNKVVNLAKPKRTQARNTTTNPTSTNPQPPNEDIDALLRRLDVEIPLLKNYLKQIKIEFLEKMKALRRDSPENFTLSSEESSPNSTLLDFVTSEDDSPVENDDVEFRRISRSARRRQRRKERLAIVKDAAASRANRPPLPKIKISSLKLEQAKKKHGQRVQPKKATRPTFCRSDPVFKCKYVLNNSEKVSGITRKIRRECARKSAANLPTTQVIHKIAEKERDVDFKKPDYNQWRSNGTEIDFVNPLGPLETIKITVHDIECNQMFTEYVPMRGHNDSRVVQFIRRSLIDTFNPPLPLPDALVPTKVQCEEDDDDSEDDYGFIIVRSNREYEAIKAAELAKIAADEIKLGKRKREDMNDEMRPVKKESENTYTVKLVEKEPEDNETEVQSVKKELEDKFGVELVELVPEDETAVPLSQLINCLRQTKDLTSILEEEISDGCKSPESPESPEYVTMENQDEEISNESTPFGSMAYKVYKIQEDLDKINGEMVTFKETLDDLQNHPIAKRICELNEEFFGVQEPSAPFLEESHSDNATDTEITDQPSFRMRQKINSKKRIPPRKN